MSLSKQEEFFFTLWKHYPKKWEYLKEIEKRLFGLEKQGVKVKNRHWFLGFKTCEMMEKEFKEMDKQKSLFDLDDEPLKDCFCKI